MDCMQSAIDSCLKVLRFNVSIARVPEYNLINSDLGFFRIKQKSEIDARRELELL